jgi:hypothetical protein
MRHHTLLAAILLAALPTSAAAQDAESSPALPAKDGAPPASSDTSGTNPRWHLDLSLTNLLDGNINHDPVPVTSYGVIPALRVGYESSAEPAFTWGYEIAANAFTGTNEWDRISHGVSSTYANRSWSRVRFETTGAAVWKGSSEDRELTNEYGISERAVLRVLSGTRVILTAAYRYKQYPDDPETSGPSPFIAGKIDQRLGGERRLTLGYKYQTRLSRAARDRYRRQSYTAAFSTPLGRLDRLAIEFEYRPQVYDQRLIRVNGVRVERRDRRFVVDATYRRPLTARVDVEWHCGVEARDSNDLDKRYVAPAMGVAMTYHWR